MTVRRVMGIETEYGISVPGDPTANPMLWSGHVVNAYVAASAAGRTGGERTSWDFEDEAPLRDARGFELSRQLAHASQLTDEDDPTVANTVLTNGARLYVDHAHPEYSSPEVTTPRDAVCWDRAGERVMRQAVRALSRSGDPGVNLYKNNTDGKGASYGTHENYLMSRQTPFGDIARGLIPFFVVRQIICGAGRVGLGGESQRDGFQISQRADFFETEVGLETTLKRPIVNTRDEPHALADRYRRLHVILGDANHSDTATLLKLGTTSLVLAMIEDGELDLDVELDDPLAALRAVSHDSSLSTTVRLRDGRRLTGIQLLWSYLEQVQAYLQRRNGQSGPDTDTAEVMRLWESVLTRLERDPRDCAREVDWVAKLGLVEGYRERDGLSWGDPRLALVDIQWSDVRTDKGLANRMRERGRLSSLVEEEEVVAAMFTPPEDTRAWFRGQCLAKFAPQVHAASWDSLIFDVPGQVSLQRVPMLDPLRGTRKSVGALLDACDTAEELLAALVSEAR